MVAECKNHSLRSLWNQSGQRGRFQSTCVALQLYRLSGNVTTSYVETKYKVNQQAAHSNRLLALSPTDYLVLAKIVCRKIKPVTFPVEVAMAKFSLCDHIPKAHDPWSHILSFLISKWHLTKSTSQLFGAVYH